MGREWPIHYFNSVQRKPKEAALYEWRMKWQESTDWLSGVRTLMEQWEQSPEMGTNGGTDGSQQEWQYSQNYNKIYITDYQVGLFPLPGIGITTQDWEQRVTNQVFHVQKTA